MDANINLLKRAQTPQTQKKRIIKILNSLTLVSLIFFVLVFLLAFLLNYFLRQQIKVLNQKTKSLEIKNSALTETEVAYRAVSERLAALEKILNNEQPFEEHLENLQKILPSEVLLSQLSLSGAKFSVGVKAPTLSSLNLFIENLISKDLGGKSFGRIVLEGLSLSEEGTYLMNVSGEVL